MNNIWHRRISIPMKSHPTDYAVDGLAMIGSKDTPFFLISTVSAKGSSH